MWSTAAAPFAFPFPKASMASEEGGGYVIAPNGLQWQDEVVGTGPSPVKVRRAKCSVDLKCFLQKFNFAYYVEGGFMAAAGCKD